MICISDSMVDSFVRSSFSWFTRFRRIINFLFIPSSFFCRSSIVCGASKPNAVCSRGSLRLIRLVGAFGLIVSYSSIYVCALGQCCAVLSVKTSGFVVDGAEHTWTFVHSVDSFSSALLLVRPEEIALSRKFRSTVGWSKIEFSKLLIFDY